MSSHWLTIRHEKRVLVVIIFFAVLLRVWAPRSTWATGWSRSPARTTRSPMTRWRSGRQWPGLEFRHRFVCFTNLR